MAQNTRTRPRGAVFVYCFVVSIVVSLSAQVVTPPQDGAHLPAPKRPAAKYDISHIGARGIGSGINLYSIERERELGRELAAQAESGMRFVEDASVTGYVNRLAQNLVRNSDAKVPFTVKVVDSDEVNAFSLPGGFLYVNRGLLVACESEGELAGVLAHEISHVAARHATKNETRRQLFTLATIPLSFIGGGAATVISQATGIAGPVTFMKFSRNAEREADLLGIEYAYAAGYDPNEFVHLLERMLKQSKTKGGKAALIAKLFATHPMTEDRIRRAQAEISTMLPAKAQYVLTTSDFDNLKAKLLDLQSRKDEAPAPDRPVLRQRESK